MKITEYRLRKIIKEEIIRKLLLEAPAFDELISAIDKEKIKDSDVLSNAMQQWVAAGGDKNAFKDSANLQKLKDAFKEQGGDDKNVDTLSKEVISGKMQVVGDMASAAAKAADILGVSNVSDDLKTAVNALKNGKDFDSLPTKSKLALGAVGSSIITQDAQKTVAAANILKKVGEKT
jgi:hypothetical protein